MEEECEVFIDPEEDEIFFGKVTHKEDSISEKNKDTEPEDVRSSVIVNTKTSNDDEIIENNVQHDVFNENSHINANDQSLDALCRGILEDMLDNITFSDCSVNDDDFVIKKTSPKVMKESFKNPEVPVVNVTTTPVKSIIDKSILSTPKSVVKADKDGGFLKVLSEIALVKAEADFEKSNGKDDDDEKENKSANVCLSVPDIKVIEATPDKGIKSPSPKKISQDVRKFRFIYNTPEKKDSSDCNDFLSNAKKIQEIPAVDKKEEKLIKENVKPKEHKKLDDVVEFLKKNLEQFENDQKCLKSALKDVIIKESGDDKVIAEKNLESVKTEKIQDVNVSSSSDIEIIEEIPVKEKFLNKKEVSVVKVSEKSRTATEIINELFANDLTNLKEASKDILVKEEIGDCKKVDEEELELVKTEKIEDVNVSSNSDVQILEDHPVEDQLPLEKKDHPTVRMSEDARKIVQILNNESVDDSFNLTVQEIDVDKTQIPFASPDTSDIFNDSLPKPPAVLSNKQAELLKEILSNSPAKANSPVVFKTPNTKVMMVEKKIEEVKMISTSVVEKKIEEKKIESTPVVEKKIEEKKIKSTPVVANKTPVSKILSNVKGNSVKRELVNRPKTVEKEKKATPAIVKKTPLSAVSGRLNPIERNIGSARKCAKKLDVDEKCAKAELNKQVESAEKEAKVQSSSKIPKFNVGTKIPVSAKKVNPHQPIIKSSTPARTFLPRTPKAAFAKIESPVNAYIHNRPTPLIKNIKPEIKKDSGKKVWMKFGSGKKCASEEKNLTDRCKSALPFVEYRSATPLKLEKQIESRLPRLAPTMKKLLTTNSPTVLRHEGRIHLSAPRKVQVSAVDSSVMVDPNEVSVVVSHVAQKSNTISK